MNLRVFLVFAAWYYWLQSWPTIFTQPHITHFEKRNSRPDISTLTAYEITLKNKLKHVFHETKNEELHIRIIIPKSKSDFYQTELLKTYY